MIIISNNNGIKMHLNESDTSNELICNIYDDAIVFRNDSNDDVGCLCFSCSTPGDIYSEYSDSVDDFDESVMRKFSYDIPVVNIEDVWVNRDFRGKGMFMEVFDAAMRLLEKRYGQFILRACSDNGFPESKLVEIYQRFGFIKYQETDNDGTIMYKIL